MAAEKTSSRMPYHKLIEYTVVVLKDGRLKFLELSGRAINISTNGLCFFTKYPLKTGCVVEFRDKVFQARHGVVMWIRRIGGIYMAGTRLIKRGDLN